MTKMEMNDMTNSLMDEFMNSDEFEKIRNMSDHDAALILSHSTAFIAIARGNSKTIMSANYIVAMSKAIRALERKVLYICDQTKCENCSASEGMCHHTTDIDHAANFLKQDNDIYMEIELLRAVETENSKTSD